MLKLQSIWRKTSITHRSRSRYSCLRLRVVLLKRYTEKKIKSLLQATVQNQ
jgi:hypothetical protein